MRPEFIIKEAEEHLISHLGLVLIGALMDRIELGTRIIAVMLPGWLNWQNVCGRSTKTGFTVTNGIHCFFRIVFLRTRR